MRHIPKVGAFVLETLTTGMYTDPFDCIREYIQNASDSIFNAERFSQLEKNNGRIEVSINPQKRTLSIRDNGVGISSAEAESKLLNIGMSDKVYGEEAGFRGIGRLAGIAYCDRLKFITSAKHEDEMSVLTFDCESIRRSISPSVKQIEELTNVLEKHVSQDLEPTKKNDHFLEVRMEGLDESVAKFLDVNQLEEYLGQVAPVEYDAQRFVFATKIEKWVADHKISVPSVQLVLQTPETQRQVFKPYKTHYKTKKGDYDFDIQDIVFYPDELKDGRRFWMWYAKTPLLGMFDDDRVSGLRFRRNNIAIGGPQRVAELFSGGEGRLNYWTMGEIHILTSDIVPNARRDGFEATPGWLELKQDLDPFIRQHSKACHDLSSSKNRPAAKIIASARSTVASTKSTMKLGLSSQEEQEQLLSNLARERERVAAAIDRTPPGEEKMQLLRISTSLGDLKKTLEENAPFTVGKLKSNLDRKQRKLLIEVLGLINSALSESKCAKNKSCLGAIKKAIATKYQLAEN